MWERVIQGSARALAMCRLRAFLMMSPAQDDRSGRFEPGRNEERPVSVCVRRQEENPGRSINRFCDSSQGLCHLYGVLSTC